MAQANVREMCCFAESLRNSHNPPFSSPKTGTSWESGQLVDHNPYCMFSWNCFVSLKSPECMLPKFDDDRRLGLAV